MMTLRQPCEGRPASPRSRQIFETIVPEACVSESRIRPCRNIVDPAYRPTTALSHARERGRSEWSLCLPRPDSAHARRNRLNAATLGCGLELADWTGTAPQATDAKARTAVRKCRIFDPIGIRSRLIQLLRSRDRATNTVITARRSRRSCSRLPPGPAPRDGSPLPPVPSRRCAACRPIDSDSNRRPGRRRAFQVCEHPA